jgi:hypothetical protein
MVWEVNTAQLVRIAVNALQNASLKAEQPAIDHWGDLGYEGCTFHRRLLLVGTGHRNELPPDIIGVPNQEHWYAARRMAEDKSKTASKEFHQLTETIPLRMQPSDASEPADKNVRETIKTVIRHGEKVQGARAWLDQQGFHLGFDQSERLPEPFHGFREIYGGSPGSNCIER